MYALAIMPLLETIVHDLDATDLKQVAFADDLTGVGNLKSLSLLGRNPKIWSLYWLHRKPKKIVVNCER